MAYAALVNESTDNIEQTWSGSAQQAIDLVAPTGYRKQQLNQTEWDSIKAGKLKYPNGAFRWQYPVGGPLTEVQDARFGLAFTPSTVEALRGGSNSTTDVDIQVYDADNNPATLTGQIDLITSDGKWTRLGFSNGQATLTISLAEIRSFSIGQGGNGAYRFLAPLIVKVIGDNAI